MLSPSNLLHALVLIVLAVLVTANGVVKADERLTVEVFTASDLPIDTDFKADARTAAVDVYEIDGIEQFEAELCRGLPANADAAKRWALERIGQLSEGQMQHVQRAARGLSKAVQYGIHRYPAIVLDGQAVVYGVTDVGAAFHRYRQWQEAAGQ